MPSKIEILGNNHIKLPQWLDNLIYGDYVAQYQPCCKDLVVLNWNRKEIIQYLGTYFPRSFAESYCIFTKYFTSHKDKYSGKEILNIFDFGCGTGGELLGLLWAIIENLNVSQINIKALDGNPHGLRVLESIVGRFNNEFKRNIEFKPLPIQIDDIYDMSLVIPCIPQENDIILIFKSLCEMASLRQFEERNPYEHILKIMQDRMHSEGIICLADVTTFNKEQQEWLPKLIDKGCREAQTNVIMRNSNFNESFCVSHSKKKNDGSKLCWRILNRAEK